MKLSDVQKHFSHYRHLFGDSWDEACQLMCQALPKTLWVHPQRSTLDFIAKRFTQSGHRVKKITWLPGSLEIEQGVKLGRRLEFRAGLFHLQEAASMLPPLILDPKPGETVLDLCAAPGGKSAQIALMMNNQGTLVVNDLSYARLRALRGIQERLGISNMVLCAQNGQSFMKDYSACFDKVLVDVPCSCEGTVRKHGLGVFKSNIQAYQKNLVYLQRRLLERALKLCKVGGRVVYSTCTFNPEENEGVVSEMLRRYPEALELEEIYWPGLEGAHGVHQWQDQNYHSQVSSCLRIHPQIQNTGGFFVASFKIKSLLTQANPGLWSQPQLLDQSQNDDYHQWLQNYYGMNTEHILGRFTVGTKRLVSMISPNLLLPPVDCQVAGLPVFHRGGSVPHLTQAAALHWGQLAQQRIIDLNDSTQADIYYRRQSIIRDDQKDTQGDYIIRYQGISLGTGFLRVNSDEAVLESHYPKAWRLSETASAFEDE